MFKTIRNTIQQLLFVQALSKFNKHLVLMVDEQNWTDKDVHTLYVRAKKLSKTLTPLVVQQIASTITHKDTIS